MKIYIGSNPKKTHKFIEKNHFGLCLNIFKGFDKIKGFLDFKNNLFIDNGSYERFNLFLKEKISQNEYFDYSISKDYFSYITNEYKKLLKIRNEKLILTIPEVIGNLDLTIKLQKEFLNEYKELKGSHNIIVALQFNPNSKNWFNECVKGMIWIKENIPKNWIIGIPFGKDFKVISGINKKSNKNFKLLMNIFIKILKEYKIHFFALGTINKIKKILPYEKYIYSFDASSVNVWSRNSHYLNKISHKIMDIRNLTGKRCSEKLYKKKIYEFEMDSNMKINQWLNISFENKFRKNIMNFSQILVHLGLR